MENSNRKIPYQIPISKAQTHHRKEKKTIIFLTWY